MDLNAMIEALQALKAKHGGDLDVTFWEYSGGGEDLMNACPTHDAETKTVVIEPKGRHWSQATR